MGSPKTQLTDVVQKEVLEELRKLLSKDFGISLVEDSMTLRWNKPGTPTGILDAGRIDRRVSFQVTDIVHGEYVESKIWLCERRIGLFSSKQKLFSSKRKKEYCEYDEVEDPMHDQCVWCGEPEERK